MAQLIFFITFYSFSFFFFFFPRPAFYVSIKLVNSFVTSKPALRAASEVSRTLHIQIQSIRQTFLSYTFHTKEEGKSLRMIGRNRHRIKSSCHLTGPPLVCYITLFWPGDHLHQTQAFFLSPKKNDSTFRHETYLSLAANVHWSCRSLIVVFSKRQSSSSSGLTRTVQTWPD